MALPFHSVDTAQEALMIQVRHCRSQYDGRFTLNSWGGEVDDVMTLADTLELT